MKKIKSLTYLIVFFIGFNLFSSSRTYAEVVGVSTTTSIQGNTILIPDNNFTMIETNKNYELSLTSSDSVEDNYILGFNLKKSGYVNIDLTDINSNYENIGYYNIEVLDQDNNVIKYINTLYDNSNEGNYFYKVGLWYGNYKIKLTINKNSYIDTTLKIPFKIEFTETDFFEKEGVNNNIRLNAPYQGVSNICDYNPNYTDKYNFTTRFNDNIYIYFKYINKEDYSTSDYINLSNSDKDINSGYSIYEFENLGEGLYKLSLSDLPEDDYELKVTIYSNNVPYEIKVIANENAFKEYYVINNESVDINTEKYSGTLKSSDTKTQLSEKDSENIFIMDKNFDFDVASNKNKLLYSQQYIMKNYEVGNERLFWVTDITTNEDYQLNAKLNYSGSKCNVWVDKNNSLSYADAIRIGQEFDSKIYTAVTTNFGQPSDVDGDNKVNILCYDIKDGFYGSGGYVAGYFYARDLYNVENSNNCEVFYIDTYPSISYDGKTDVTKCFNTLAHEFQHMINFNQNVIIENNMYEMSTWIDEALSMAAEQIYSNKPLINRIEYYNKTQSINDGRALIYWNNYNDVLANYSLSYIFGQYLKLQANQGNSIFKEILNNKSNNYIAIEEVIKKYIDKEMSFAQFTTHFRMALAQKSSSGLDGFKDAFGFNMIKTKVFKGYSANLLGTSSVLVPIQDIPLDKGDTVVYRKVLIPAYNRNIDIDDNEVIDIRDLAKVALNYNTSIENKNWVSKYDINIDYFIDLYDLVNIGKVF